MNIIVTTTDHIENRCITGYIGILRSSAVVGTEIALADIFADSSRKYRRKLDDIYSKALQDIRLKALAAGADAVVGLHTEFQEIFGKGKTRFLVSVLGTAVRLDRPKAEQDGCKNVTLFDLRRNQLLVGLGRKLSNPQFNPSSDDWDDINRYALVDLAPQLYRRYLKLASETIGSTSVAEKKLLLENFIPFLQSMDYDAACEAVYGDIETSPYVFCDVVKSCDLFHPEKIAQMLHPENKHTVIALLDSNKASYTSRDLVYMDAIAGFLDNLPDTGRYIEGREGLFSKTGTLLVCERGHTSAVELGGHCTGLVEGSGAICNLNVKGITEQEVAAICKFKEKVEILRGLIDNEM